MIEKKKIMWLPKDQGALVFKIIGASAGQQKARETKELSAVLTSYSSTGQGLRKEDEFPGILNFSSLFLE